MVLVLVFGNLETPQVKDRANQRDRVDDAAAGNPGRGQMRPLELEGADLQRVGGGRQRVGGVVIDLDEEFDLVADGDTESEAVINLMNLLTASLSFAHRRGNLDAILNKAGVHPLDAMPKEQDAPGGHKLWFMPMIENARAAAGS